MPFGKWKDIDTCITEFVKQGKDQESAKKICEAIQTKQTQGKESFSWVGNLESFKLGIKAYFETGKTR